MNTSLCTVICLAALLPALWARADWKQYDQNPFVMQLDIPAPLASEGGIVAADLTGDGRMDYLVTVEGHVTAQANDGRRLWTRAVDIQIGGSAERSGLPGHNAPGVTASDIDGDGRTEVLFLTRSRALHVLDGRTGKRRWTAEPPYPDGAERWEHLVVANFRGEGDRDLLLQATNKQGYRVGHYIAAYALQDLREGRYQPLWERDDFLTSAHNGARIADLDGDQRHMVLGGDIVSADGDILFKLPLQGHIDAIGAYKVREDIPGLQVVAVEEGGAQRVFLYNHEGLIWEADYENREPQNFAAGRFDAQRPGKQIWNRSRFNVNQKPFVFGAHGELVTRYAMAEAAPPDWTLHGVELIWPVHWTGGETQLLAATERGKSGDVAVFRPLTGEFVQRVAVQADRLYVADVSGDWREEIVVLAGTELRIYHNPRPNPNPGRARLWEQDHYRRSKLTYNYYSP